MRVRILLVLAIVGGLCGNVGAQPRGGAVRPAPPGPLDVLRMGVWGDYSGLCPKHYDFCRAGRQSICCPGPQGCCDDERGPYCCAGSGGRYLYEEDEMRSQTACSSRDISCSQGGRTICCYSSDRCCADENGPFCCAERDARDRYDTRERYEYRERTYNDD